MQIVHLRIPRGGGSLRSTWSDLLFVPYNHHNAFNVKRRSDTVGVAWPVDLWEMAEVRKRALRGEGGRQRFGRQFMQRSDTRAGCSYGAFNIGARNLAGKGQFEYEARHGRESSGLVSFGG